MATDYAKKTNAELIEILKSRNLPHTGKKADMVARLQEDDSAKPAAPAAENADDVIDWDDEVPAAAEPTKPAETATATATETATAPAPPAPAEEDLKTKADEGKTGAEAQADPATETAETGTVVPSGAEEQAAQQPVEEKPAPNFSIGLSVTDLEEELKKRKARAEKFGITEDSQAAIDDAEKKLERAKRFGTAGEEAPSAESVSRLDQALPEKSRKRGRGENDQGGRGGKRRNQNGRGNNQRQRGRGNRDQGQGQQKQGQAQKPAATASASNGWSDKDKAALEARKKRFATGA
ncbi:hypothetical protein BDW74DRAFT_55009 [Aspergillus multicolor]|uniref:SAP domain-containing protein n=1 Tax=Aspergillus multicolor TaxID=41759 RepID=UPI003CCD2BA9